MIEPGRTFVALAASERAKRVLVCGLLASVVMGAWLFSAWRASRYRATECVVQEAPDRGGVYCTVAHRTADGVEHSLPWETCGRSTLAPVADVGARLPCFFFVSRPDAIVFDAPAIAWATVPRLVAFGAALAVAGFGAVLLARASGARRRRPHAEPPSPYRVADRPPPRDARTPIVVSLSGPRGWLAWGLALPFLLLGTVLLALAAHLAWHATGDVGAGGVCFLLFAAVVPLAGLLGVGYRSGITVDHEAGTLSWWWGLWRPWFFTHYRIESIEALAVAEVRHRTRVVRRLELRLKSGQRRTYASDAEPAEVVEHVGPFDGRGSRSPS